LHQNAQLKLFKRRPGKKESLNQLNMVNGKLHCTCFDYIVDINQFSKLNYYSIPKIEDLYAIHTFVIKVYIFNVLLMKSQNMSIPSILLVVYFPTINFRLEFPLSPAIFHKCNGNLLEWIPMTCEYKDDIFKLMLIMFKILKLYSRDFLM